MRTSALQSKDAIVRTSLQRLAENANDHAAVHVLAAASLARQNPAESLRILESQPQSVIENATGNRLAGYAWLLKDELARARTCFDRAVRLDPHLTDCWNLLGKIAEGQERPDDAVRYYRRAIVFENAGHESAIALSKLQAKQARVRDAIHTLRISLLRDQREPKLNLALARLLERRAVAIGKQRYHKRALRLRKEALECYERANAAAPTCKTLIAQGLLEQRLERIEAAVESFRRAVARNPQSSIALSSLAAANVDLGHLDKAHEQFKAAFALDPTRAIGHFRYTRAQKFKPGVETTRYTKQLRQQLAADHLPRRQRLHLHFAIAKVLDDTGEHDEAWKHFDLGNRLNPGHSDRAVSRPSTLREHAEECEQFFTREWFETQSRRGSHDTTPVLIVGMPRSGTTLTEQILSSHPMVAGAGELNHWNQIRHEIARERTDSQPSRRSEFTPGLDTISTADLGRLAGDYIERLNEVRTDERHVTDKMPTNFMFLGLVATLFPKATIIHCRRNPMDVLTSCYCQNLSAPFCDLDQLVAYHRTYRRMMRHWERVLPIRIHTVDYEAMVCEPEAQTRALLSHCGLPWDAKCLEFQSNARAVHTPSKWQVRQPMYRSSVEKWRRFEKHLAPIATRIQAELDDENWHGERAAGH